MFSDRHLLQQRSLHCLPGGEIKYSRFIDWTVMTWGEADGLGVSCESLPNSLRPGTSMSLCRSISLAKISAVFKIKSGICVQESS